MTGFYRAARRDSRTSLASPVCLGTTLALTRGTTRHARLWEGSAPAGQRVSLMFPNPLSGGRRRGCPPGGKVGHGVSCRHAGDGCGTFATTNTETMTEGRSTSTLPPGGTAGLRRPSPSRQRRAFSTTRRIRAPRVSAALISWAEPISNFPSEPVRPPLNRPARWPHRAAPTSSKGGAGAPPEVRDALISRAQASSETTQHPNEAHP